jgi:hypothetical protein
VDQESHEQKLQLLRTAAFGRQVEEFWSSDIGKYLHLHASTCYSSAIEELKSVNPSSSAEVMQAQGKAWQAENFILWMEEAIQRGLESLNLLEGNTDDDVPQD